MVFQHVVSRQSDEKRRNHLPRLKAEGALAVRKKMISRWWSNLNYIRSRLLAG